MRFPSKNTSMVERVTRTSTFYALPIVGMNEYRSGMDSLANMLLAAGMDNTDFTYWTEEDQATFWAEYGQCRCMGQPITLPVRY